jgi:hypothetical protein
MSETMAIGTVNRQQAFRFHRRTPLGVGVRLGLAACRCGRFQGFLATSPWTLRMIVPRFGHTVRGMDLIVVLLVVLIVLALVGSIAVSPLLWALVVILVLFAVLGRGRYYARRR